jgi:signal transduction histidine kinase
MDGRAQNGRSADGAGHGPIVSGENRLYLVWLAAGIVSVPIYFALAGIPAVQAFLLVGANGLVVVALVTGIYLYRPPASDVWWLLASGQFIATMASLAWYVYPVAFHGNLPFPSAADALFLLSYAVDALALFRLVQHSRKPLRRGDLMDGFIVTLGLAALSVHFIIEPVVQGPGSVFARVVSVAYPTMDLVLLGLLLSLIVAPSRPRLRDALLAAFVVCQLAGDTGFSLSVLHGTFVYGQPSFGFWLLSYGFLGSAALYQPVRNLAKAPDSKPTPNLSRRRLLLLVGAALIPTAIMLYEDALVTPDLDNFILDTMAGLFFVIALTRAAELGVSLNEHQRVLAELEKEVQVRRRIEAELKRSNAELEQFAYVASHDLQEPLRMVASYVQLLARRYQGKLEGDADEFIQFAVDGATRMQALINDLLAYSRVGSKGKPLLPTDLDSVLDDALANLSVRLSETKAEVTRAPLPPVVADSSQLTQLFQNLIGNALKFVTDGHPQVRVAATSDEGLVRISVSDNGNGIDPRFEKRIFEVFQRLHTREEYPGTGIGLAVCRKIVERHGGRIWVESKPGRGATFHFTLRPAQKVAEATSRGRSSLKLAESGEAPA